MELFAALANRRSVRRFSDKPVDDEQVIKVLAAAHWAPSAHNKQPWHFIVTRDQGKKETVGQASRWAKFLPQAPVAIIVCTRTDFHWKDTSQKWIQWFSVQSSAAAIQNLLLGAHGLGLGACWLGDIDEELVRKIFTIPPGHEPVAIIALGHPADEVQFSPPPRRPLAEVISWDE